ncbi:MAG: hypothetical protein FJ253_11675, partial [Phycisphaerae bacterium]|nr:hypothetical protein [Phycisphaerae bacterium]
MTASDPRDERDPHREPSDDELLEVVTRALSIGRERATLHATHASRVVVGGGFAIKFKRRVNLGFLDQRSIDSRGRLCRDEVRLNRRLASEVYLGVVALRAVGVALELDAVPRGTSDRLEPDAPPLRAGGEDESSTPSPGTIVDWAVVMRELPQELMLDQLFRSDEQSRTPEMSAALARVPQHLEQLAARLADFHRHAERGPEIAAQLEPANLRARVEQLLDGLEAAIVGTAEAATAPARESIAATPTAPAHVHAGSPALRRFLRARCLELLESSRAVIESRRLRGCVVDGHGDLHCRNICMTPGGAVAFDCLEFSQALRVRDTSAEMAFLAMDLEAHGRPELAEAAIAAYLRRARRDPATASREADFDEPQRWYRLRDALVRSLVELLRTAGSGSATRGPR